MATAALSSCAPERRPTDWRPTPGDVTAVLDLTAGYFADRASGRYRQAWDRLTASMQEMSPLGEYRARQEHLAALGKNAEDLPDMADPQDWRDAPKEGGGA